MGPIGVQEMIFVFILALLLFGPKKLPELGRMLGKGLSEFRRAKNELKSTFESHMRELERETNTSSQSNAPATYSPKSYSYPYDEQAHTNTADPYRPYDYDYSPPAQAPSIPEPQIDVTQPNNQNGDHSHAEIAPVPGTVARTNGIQPSDPHVAQEGERHA